VFSSLYNFSFSTALYGWIIYQHPAGAWTLVLFNGTGASSFFQSDFGHIPIIPNSWYHLALTDDGNNIQLYVNGVAGSAGTTVAASGFIPNGVNGDPSVSASPEVLGQRSDGAFYGFSGGVDEVAFYNHALTPQQVAAHFANSTKLSLAQYGTDIVLSWSLGTLQSGPAVNGTYVNVQGATSPYTNIITGNTKFFRLQLQ
jgi:hypothetical protein